MGRPTKFDTEVADRICEAISLGNTWNLAARAGGVDPKTLREWKARGRAGEEPYGPFLLRLKKAEAEATNEALRVIRDAAQAGTWQAAAWLLERRHPRSFGRSHVRADITAKVESLSPEAAQQKFLSMVSDLALSNPAMRAELVALLHEKDANDSH